MLEKFELQSTPDGDVLRVNKRGPDLLRYPLYNKGTGFTAEERQELGIEGLLPAECNSIDQQAARIYKSIFYNQDSVGRNIALGVLQDRNEVLFYKLLSEHLETIMPIVYTPTVGEASRYYSRVYRRGRGLFITPDHRGRIADVLRNAPFADVTLMVVTDNEAILGIGDQGVGGMAISLGKLALYCAGAGIHPAATLPISLDVGTNNEALLNDPMYLGFRERRLRGSAYDELVDEFVTAVKSVFPRAMIQWEDFRKDNALAILDRHRDTIPSFNDDIQGTGAVAAACIKAGCRIRKTPFRDSKTIIYGAGAAGLGIARQLRAQLGIDGLSAEQQRAAVLVMDSRGIVSADREKLDDYKREFAWSKADVDALRVEGDDVANLAAVIEAYGASVLVGASGQAGAFDQTVVRAMSNQSDQPIVLPMSNPTSISEATPADILQWTNYRALIATGSPFDPVETPSGSQSIGQANNVYVFPGIGLGCIVSGAQSVTDEMIAAAANALAEVLSNDDLDSKRLMPEVSRLWEVCGVVAFAVAAQAMKEGVATLSMDDNSLRERLEKSRWRPNYPTIVSTCD